MLTETTTKRLRVYHLVTQATEDHALRHVYIGIPTDEDWPFVAITATVWPIKQLGGMAHLDWIETSVMHRRRGYATEMVKMLEMIYGGSLSMDAATDEGEGFVTSLMKQGATA